MCVVSRLKTTGGPRPPRSPAMIPAREGSIAQGTANAVLSSAEERVTTRCIVCEDGAVIRRIFCLPCYQTVVASVRDDRERVVEVRSALSGALLKPAGLRDCKAWWSVKSLDGILWEMQDGDTWRPVAQKPVSFLADGCLLLPDEPLGVFGTCVRCLCTHPVRDGDILEKPCCCLEGVSTPPTPPMRDSPRAFG